VVYGQDYLFSIVSRPGEGTQIRFEIPELVTGSPSKHAESAAVS